MEEIYGVTIRESEEALPCLALVGKLEPVMNDMVSSLVSLVRDKTGLAEEDSLRMFLENNVKADILQVLDDPFSMITCKLGTFTSHVSAGGQGFIKAMIVIATQDKTVEYHIDLAKDLEH